MITSVEAFREFRQSMELSERKEELANGDVLLLHHPISLDTVDTSVPKILFYHGSFREYNILYDYHSSRLDQAERWELDRNVSAINNEIADMMSQADEIVTVSEFAHDQVKKHLGLDSTVIYPPIDRDKFSPEPVDGDYFLSVQRLDWSKRVHAQINAFSELDERLLICGTGRHNDIISRQADKHDNIEYLGYVSDKRLIELYSGANAFVHTSVRDIFPYTPREAMSCGTPVIAPNSGGHTEMPDYSTLLFDSESITSGLRGAVSAFEPSEYTTSQVREETAQYGSDRISEQVNNLAADISNRNL